MSSLGIYIGRFLHVNHAFSFPSHHNSCTKHLQHLQSKHLSIAATLSESLNLAILCNLNNNLAMNKMRSASMSTSLCRGPKRNTSNDPHPIDPREHSPIPWAPTMISSADLIHRTRQVNAPAAACKHERHARRLHPPAATLCIYIRTSFNRERPHGRWAREQDCHNTKRAAGCI